MLGFKFKNRRSLNLLGLLALLCLAIFIGASTSHAEEDFLDPGQAFKFTAAMADPLNLHINYQIAPDYYMYQERFEVKVSDSQQQLLFYRESTLFPEDETAKPAWDEQLIIPKGTITYDPTFEKNMEVFHNQVSLGIPLKPGASGPLQVSITGQGCADSGLCYPPMTETLQLVASADGYIAQGDKVVASVPPPQLNTAASSTTTDTTKPAASNLFALGDVGMAAWLHDAAMWQILLLSLVFGALLSLTPCVLPMVPILVAIIAGQAATVSRFKGFSLAAVYVLGMSLVYTVLGVIAGLMGAGLAAWLQSPWVLGSFAVLLALFALAMLDVFTLQTPTGMQSSIQGLMQKMPGGNITSVFLMGMLSALIVGPCVAAPLAGILLFISQTGDVYVGGMSLFAMAWGEGLLLLVVGAGAGALIPKAGAWMNTLKYAFGILLLATAWWMARPLLPAALYVGGWSLLGIWFALLLWQYPYKAAADSVAVGLLFLRSIAIMLMLWALILLLGLAAGGSSLLRPLAPFAASSNTVAGAAVDLSPEAIRQHFTVVTDNADLEQQLQASTKPVMLDFYADWCVSCLEMEKFTFSDPKVAEQMGQMLLLQADVTKMTTADRELLARFNLFGPPGIMFFDSNGQLLEQERVVGFKNASEFAAVLQRVINN